MRRAEVVGLLLKERPAEELAGFFIGMFEDARVASLGLK
jgi:hypothetical protein